MVDTQVYTAKLYTTDGGAKLIRRPEGHIEKQYRQNLGKLPIAYRRAACAGPCGAHARLRRQPRAVSSLCLFLVFRNLAVSQ